MFCRMMFASAFANFVSSLGFNGQTYSDSTDAVCSVSLTVKNNGTWAVTSTGINSLNVTGNWANGAPITGVGGLVVVRFTRTALGGNCGSATNSTGWLSLSTDQGVTATALASGATCSRTATYTVEFSGDGGGTVGLSGTITLSAGAIYNPN